MTKKFGPTRGAGVSIEEQDGDKQITPGALGWAGYAGIFEKGPVGELIVISGGATEFARRMGGIIDASLAPDCAQDFFRLANGAGGLVLVRVTDGTEEPAKLPLYARISDPRTRLGTLTAANGGRWGGKELRVTEDLDNISDLTETTLQLPASIATDYDLDKLVGGYIELSAVPNTRYKVISSTAAGLLTVASDQTMLTSHGGGSDLRFYVVLENEAKAISAIIGDGEEKPDENFSLALYVDGALVIKWGDLHADPDNANYWADKINQDQSNKEIVATDVYTGAYTGFSRPANYYGEIATITDTVLTSVIHEFAVATSPTGANPTLALGATTDAMIDQTITLTFSSPTAFDAVSDKFGALGSGVVATPFVPNNKWTPPFTVTNGATVIATSDVLRIVYKPFVPSAMVNGYVYADKVNAKRTKYRVTANDHKTITVSAGSTMTDVAAIADKFMVAYAQEFAGGKDGNASVGDTHYSNQAWDVDASPFNDVTPYNLGLIKFATPGVTSTVVQKAGVSYAEAKNHQYRYECLLSITAESDAMDYVNDTLGRSDYAVMAFPSYGDVPHPDPASAREKRRKTIPLTGLIHGREARIANDYKGYHKAAAGVDAKLDRVLAIPTGDRQLNQELLNPAGIAVIVKKSAGFVIWGDRTLNVDSNWKFKHHRELMSYYEQVLQSNFEFIVFAINDSTNDDQAITAFTTFFGPEFVKRALRGTSFNDACVIKVDSELNTDAVRANGDAIGQVSLKLADTVERFIIQIGRQGIFEQVA